MKKLSLGIILALFGITVACAQQKVPAEVQKSFNQKFPESKSVKWEMENASEWEAEFKMNGKEKSAGFDLQGNWQQTETEIKVAELPDAITNAIRTQFAGYKVEEPEMLEMANGEVAYEVELEKGKEEWEAVFATDGSLKSKKQLQDDNED